MEGEVIEGDKRWRGGEYEGVLPTGGFYCIYNFQTVASVDDVTIGFPSTPESVTDVIGPRRSQGVRHEISLNLIMICEYPCSLLLAALWEKGGGNERGWVGVVLTLYAFDVCALEAAPDENRTVSCRNSCSTIYINGRATSISERFCQVYSLSWRL